MSGLRVERVGGDAVRPWLDQVAALRIAVFRDWPYLYDGDPDYEANYLDRYARTDGSVFVLAIDGDRVVGASTGIPLAEDEAAFREPFEACGIEVDDVFYFGESVLLPDYRGRGLGHRFFDEREAHAMALCDYRWTAFCAVLRADDDPRRPAGHRGLEPFWRGRGYERRDEMVAELEWKEIGYAFPNVHRLRFWTKEWPRM